MTATQSPAQAYTANGYLSPVDLFSADEIAAYRQDFDRLEAREGREKCQIGLVARHFEEEFIWKMSTDPRLLDLMQQIMGPDIMLLSTHFFCKYPEADNTKFVAWHQDITYWGLEPPEAHTAWIAIDDADTANGCMQVVPASHKDGIVEHGTSQAQGNLLSINQEIPDEHIDKTKVAPLELKAGQLSLHDGQLYHASQPNRSDRRRCGLTVRYIRPEARQLEQNSHGQQWTPVLLRGQDRFGHYPVTPMPFSLPS
jgi:non-haem Fe2+, alpha-ketoglutarate-dependent halogenase